MFFSYTAKDVTFGFFSACPWVKDLKPPKLLCEPQSVDCPHLQEFSLGSQLKQSLLPWSPQSPRLPTALCSSKQTFPDDTFATKDDPRVYSSGSEVHCSRMFQGLQEEDRFDQPHGQCTPDAGDKCAIPVDGDCEDSVRETSVAGDSRSSGQQQGTGDITTGSCRINNTVWWMWWRVRQRRASKESIEGRT